MSSHLDKTLKSVNRFFAMCLVFEAIATIDLVYKAISGTVAEVDMANAEALIVIVPSSFLIYGMIIAISEFLRKIFKFLGIEES